MPLPLAVPLIGAGIQAVLGGSDLIRSGKEREEAKSFFAQNQFDIPESAKESLQIAKTQAGQTRLPGQDLLESRIEQTTGRGLRAAREVGTSSSDVLGILSDLFGQEAEQKTQLGLAGVQRQDAAKTSLRGALDKFAGLEEEKFRMNVLAPYQQQLATASQLGTRGAQSISGAASLGASAFAGQEKVQGAEDIFSQLFGG